VAVETAPGLDPWASRRAPPPSSCSTRSRSTGSSVEIELKPEGGIERSVGKARRVVDLRKK
jgi:phenylacetate-CoA ligase